MIGKIGVYRSKTCLYAKTYDRQEYLRRGFSFKPSEATRVIFPLLSGVG